jgi:hypothetical protein
VFVPYSNQNVNEDLLFCIDPENHTAGEAYQLAKATYLGTDGALGMVGKAAGVVARIIALVPSCSRRHCVLHRKALVAKIMPTNLKNVLDDAVKIVNHIKSKPLNVKGYWKSFVRKWVVMGTSL